METTGSQTPNGPSLRHWSRLGGWTRRGGKRATQLNRQNLGLRKGLIALQQTPRSGAGYLGSGKRDPEELAVNRVEEGHHDRTPLFDRSGSLGRLCFRNASRSAQNGFTEDEASPPVRWR